MADAHEPAPERRRGRGIRLRVTLVATSIVALALVVAGVGMVGVFRRTLTDKVRTDAFARAEQAVDDLDRGATPELATGDEAFVQVVDPQGRVVLASENLEGARRVGDLEPGESRSVDEVPFEEDDQFMVVAVESSADRTTVLAGQALDVVDESLAALTALLLVGVPVLAAAIGWVIWLMVGRALRPIEAIRSEVESISTGKLQRRVPVPASDDEVAHLAATMNGMLERLEEGHARERRFVSDASHELRSPVASIRQHAEVALSHPDGTSLSDLAEDVLAEDLRLQRIVEDLLMLARMDEDEPKEQRSSVDLDDLVLAEAARRDGGPVGIDAGGVSGGRVTGDPRQLERLVGNLLDNAVRHADRRVRVELSEAGGTVLLAVDDDGRGVPADERDRVFGRFVRLEGSRDRDSGGAGLGLAIVAEVAAAHGGRAMVTASELGGARFEVRWPRSG